MFERNPRRSKERSRRQTARKAPPRRRQGPREDIGLTELVHSRAGKILLLQLHPELQRLLHGSFNSACTYLLLRDAFPDRLPGMKIKFFMGTITHAIPRADPPLPEALVEHVKDDPKWVRDITALVRFIYLTVSLWLLIAS